VSRYQKGKTNQDFTEARDSEWQWHQLGHMQVYTSRSRQKTTPASHHSAFTGRMPFLPPDQQRQSSEGNRTYIDTSRVKAVCITVTVTMTESLILRPYWETEGASQNNLSACIPATESIGPPQPLQLSCVGSPFHARDGATEKAPSSIRRRVRSCVYNSD